MKKRMFIMCMAMSLWGASLSAASMPFRGISAASARIAKASVNNAPSASYLRQGLNLAGRAVKTTASTGLNLAGRAVKATALTAGRAVIKHPYLSAAALATTLAYKYSRRCRLVIASVVYAASIWTLLGVYEFQKFFGNQILEQSPSRNFYPLHIRLSISAWSFVHPDDPEVAFMGTTRPVQPTAPVVSLPVNTMRRPASAVAPTISATEECPICTCPVIDSEHDGSRVIPQDRLSVTQCCGRFLCQDCADRLEYDALELYQNRDNIAWRLQYQASPDFAGWPHEYLPHAKCPYCRVSPLQTIAATMQPHEGEEPATQAPRINV